MIYRFDHFEIDAENLELRRAGPVCHVEPKVFDLIRFFAENPGRVIDRDDQTEGPNIAENVERTDGFQGTIRIERITPSQGRSEHAMTPSPPDVLE